MIYSIECILDTAAEVFGTLHSAPKHYAGQVTRSQFDHESTSPPDLLIKGVIPPLLYPHDALFHVIDSLSSLHLPHPSLIHIPIPSEKKKKKKKKRKRSQSSSSTSILMKSSTTIYVQ